MSVEAYSWPLTLVGGVLLAAVIADTAIAAWRVRRILGRKP